MRVALLHLELSGGPVQTNLARLQAGIELAAGQGAQWVVTPETALEGYFFARKDPTVPIVGWPNPAATPLRNQALRHQLTIFLGCAERDGVTGKCYNSCFVIGPSGETLGHHRKMHVHGGTEKWSEEGKQLHVIPCPEMTAGILICADAWYVEHAKTLQEKGAEVIVVPAAWTPGEYGPGDCWERCSDLSGLPVWVCNQTGRGEEMDFSRAESAVVVRGKKKLTYSGLQQAVLLFDWDIKRQCLLSTRFRVFPLHEDSYAQRE